MIAFRYSAFSSYQKIKYNYVEEVFSMQALYIEWLKNRRKFLLPLLIFISVFYFFLPISLAFFPNFINKPTFIWGLPLIWLYAFLQIIMTLVIAHIYLLKAKKQDKLIEKMRNKL